MAAERFDAIVVGGGVQGAALAIEAARRGRHVVLLEQGMVGDGASGASLGVIHGGLRYLQTLDLPRWRTSRREQIWYRSAFPEIVRTLACTMPLYRGRMRSRAMFRTAFALDRALGGTAEGRIIEPGAVRSSVPFPRDGLVGAAVWQEAGFIDHRRLVAGLLARAPDTVLLEGRTVDAIELRGGRVAGVRAGGDIWIAPQVFLCAGAANRALVASAERDRPELSARVLAFNLLFDLPFTDPGLIAVSPTPGRGRSFFLRAHRGRLLAGTDYVPATSGRNVPVEAVAAFRAALDRAVPQMGLATAPVLEIWSGLLPDRDGSGHRLRAHDLLIDHGAAGGPAGLFTLHPTKLTTARALAERAATLAWPNAACSSSGIGNREVLDAAA